MVYGAQFNVLPFAKKTKVFTTVMSLFQVSSIKSALQTALESLPDWSKLNPFLKGKTIDKTFKSIMLDLMQQFGMEPGIDYEDNLEENAQIADFVALSGKADYLIQGLLSGKVVAISSHSRVSKLGNEYEVKAHFRDLRRSA